MKSFSVSNGIKYFTMCVVGATSGVTIAVGGALLDFHSASEKVGILLRDAAPELVYGPLKQTDDGCCVVANHTASGAKILRVNLSSNCAEYVNGGGYPLTKFLDDKRNIFGQATFEGALRIVKISHEITQREHGKTVSIVNGVKSEFVDVETVASGLNFSLYGMHVPVKIMDTVVETGAAILEWGRKHLFGQRTANNSAEEFKFDV